MSRSCASSADCGERQECVAAACRYSHRLYVQPDIAAAAARRYKYIVVGGGSAGCAAAATLAERHETLLVERGPRREVVPTTGSFDAFHARFGLGSWAAIMDMLTTTEHTRHIFPRVLGGATAFNAGIYNRDAAAPAGVFARAGWHAVSVAAAYQWVESLLQPQVAEHEREDSLLAAIRMEMVPRLGLKLDGNASIGLQPPQSLFRTYTTLPQGGRNRTAADEFLKQPGLQLTVVLEATANVLLIDDAGRAVGVEFRDERDGALHRAFVEDRGGEVVVSSGVFGTPTLLMRSGIGPASHLAEHGIPVRVDSPTIGVIVEPPAHMIGVFGTQDGLPPGLINPYAARLSKHIALEAFHHEQETRGLIASQCTLIPAPQRTAAACERLSTLLAERTSLTRDFAAIAGFGIKLLDPQSRGTVRLKSRSASDLPVVTLNQYAKQADLDKMVAGVKQIMEVVMADNLSSHRASRMPTMVSFLQSVLQRAEGSEAGEDKPPVDLPPYMNLPPEGANDSAIGAFLKDNVATMYHTCGGTFGALGPTFAVDGVVGLRVADLSILDHAPGTNPMASAMMIGRYAAQVIADDRQLRTDTVIDTAAFGPGPQSNNVNVGAVIGAVVGSVAAIAAVLGCVALRRCKGSLALRRRRLAGAAHDSKTDEPATDSTAARSSQRSTDRSLHRELVEDSYSANVQERPQRLLRQKMLLRSVAAFMQPTIHRCSVSLKDVSAFCPDREDRSKIHPVLVNVCGFLGAGKVTAIVGPSGSGKSTLMDYLARGRSHAHFTGSIRLGGIAFDKWRRANRIGFVPQHSSFIPVLSAYEHLLFQAALRMPGASRATRLVRVEKMLSLVGLAAQKHTKCGGPLPGGFMIKGLSGGQQRLLSIATVLLEENAVLLLDEPASGLDSHHALSIMLCIRVLSNMGHTVVLSVHQPSDEMWAMVDCVLALSLGRTVFSGQTSGMLPWFTRNGFTSLPTENPVSFVMDVITVGTHKPHLLYGDSTIRTADGIHTLAVDFRRVHAAKHLWQGLADLVVTGRWREGCDGLPKEASASSWSVSSGRAKRAPWLMQVATLCYRQGKLTARNPGDALARLVCYSGIGLLTGLVFKGVEDAQSWLGLLFWIANTIYLLPFAALTLYTAAKASFVSGLGEDLTDTSADLFSSSLIETVVNLCSGLVFLLPVYYIVGMHGSFGCHMSVTCISVLVSSTTLRVIIVLLPTQDMAFVLGSGLISLGMMLSGFFVKFSSMDSVFEALQWISPFRYSVGYYAQCELIRESYSAGGDELMATVEGSLPGGLGKLLKDLVPTTISGAELIGQFEYDALSAHEHLAILVAIYVALMLALYAAHVVLQFKLVREGKLHGRRQRDAINKLLREFSAWSTSAASLRTSLRM